MYKQKESLDDISLISSFIEYTKKMSRVDYINTIYFKTLISRNVISNEYDLYLYHVKYLSTINTNDLLFPL